MKTETVILRALHKFWPHVRTVVDAQRRLLIHVSAADVEASEIGKPAECALARACKREQVIDGVLVFKSTAYLRQGTHVTRFDVPESVTREIVSFDRSGAFAPGEYHLAPPPPSKRLDAPPRHRPSGKNDGSRKRLPPVHLRTDGVRPGLRGPK